jgi:hypothetical protein
MIQQITAVYNKASEEAPQEKEVNTLTKTAEADLQQMVTIANSSSPVAAKIESFTQSALELRGVLQTLRDMDARSISLAQQARAAALKAVPSDLATNANVQQDQKNAINQLKSNLSNPETSRNEAGSIRALPDPITVPTVYSAVLHYGFGFIPAMLGAVFVDLLPAAALAFEILYWGQVRSDAAQYPLARYSVRDLLEVRDILQTLTSPSDPAGPPNGSGASDATSPDGRGV